MKLNKSGPTFKRKTQTKWVYTRIILKYKVLDTTKIIPLHTYTKSTPMDSTLIYLNINLKNEMI